MEKLFANLDSYVNSQVKLDNENIMSIQRKGVINIYTKSSKIKHILDVYFKHNLMSNEKLV